MENGAFALLEQMLHFSLYFQIHKYHVFENIMENGAFALLEQMLHFSLYFQIND